MCAVPMSSVAHARRTGQDFDLKSDLFSMHRWQIKTSPIGLSPLKTWGSLACKMNNSRGKSHGTICWGFGTEHSTHPADDILNKSHSHVVENFRTKSDLWCKVSDLKFCRRKSTDFNAEVKIRNKICKQCTVADFASDYLRSTTGVTFLGFRGPFTSRL